MKKSILMDKYPVYTLELSKNEIKQKNVDEIVEYFQNKIENHPIAKMIAVFDHYAHTSSIDGEINPDIKAAKNVIFCFGKAMPNTKILAARPRSIAIADVKDKFIIEFMEAPIEEIQKIMETWAKDLKIL